MSGLCKVTVICEHPVQHYSEVFGLGVKGQGFVTEVDFQLMFSLLVVDMEDCQHHSVVMSFYLVPRQILMGCHSCVVTSFVCHYKW